MAEEGSPAGGRYYSISEVSEMLDVRPHVLRYWETQFPSLRPRKSRAGNRMYQERELDLLRSIQEMLYQRGYTIAGARAALNSLRRKSPDGIPQMDLDFLSPEENKRLRIVREELVSLRDWLSGRQKK